MSIRRPLKAIAILISVFGLSHSVAFAQATVPPLFAVLLGGNEVSNVGNIANAGDQDGHGSATVIIRGTTTLCFAILVNGIDKPTAAHIHRGPAGKNGPVVVTLIPPFTGNPGTSSRCIPGLNAVLLNQIRSQPGGFYVNIHTTLFPAGAIRGQLF